MSASKASEEAQRVIDAALAWSETELPDSLIDRARRRNMKAAEDKLLDALEDYRAAQPPAGEVLSGSVVMGQSDTVDFQPDTPPADAARAMGAGQRAKLVVDFWWPHRGQNETDARTLLIENIATTILAAEQAAEARGNEDERQRWHAYIARCDAQLAAAESEAAKLRAKVERLTKERDRLNAVVAECCSKTAQPARGDTRDLALALDRALIAGSADRWKRSQDFAATLAAWIDARGKRYDQQPTPPEPPA